MTDYPAKIDDQVFFSDLELKHLGVQQKYLELLKNGNLVEASESLQDSDANYFGAYLYNMINHRLRAIEQYISGKTKPQQIKYEPDEPSDIQTGSVWVGNGYRTEIFDNITIKFESLVSYIENYHTYTCSEFSVTGENAQPFFKLVNKNKGITLIVGERKLNIIGVFDNHIRIKQTNFDFDTSFQGCVVLIPT